MPALPNQLRPRQLLADLAGPPRPRPIIEDKDKNILYATPGSVTRRFIIILKLGAALTNKWFKLSQSNQSSNDAPRKHPSIYPVGDVTLVI